MATTSAVGGPQLVDDHRRRRPCRRRAAARNRSQAARNTESSAQRSSWSGPGRPGRGRPRSAGTRRSSTRRPCRSRLRLREMVLRSLPGRSARYSAASAGSGVQGAPVRSTSWRRQRAGEAAGRGKAVQVDDPGAGPAQPAEHPRPHLAAPGPATATTSRWSGASIALAQAADPLERTRAPARAGRPRRRRRPPALGGVEAGSTTGRPSAASVDPPAPQERAGQRLARDQAVPFPGPVAPAPRFASSTRHPGECGRPPPRPPPERPPAGPGPSRRRRRSSPWVNADRRP